MAVATLGGLKGVTVQQAEEYGQGVLLSNTYHLALRPGAETVRSLGGLHRFCGWRGPMLTDSGGYQVFSLARLRKITEQGVTFQSHLDGSPVDFTPERVVEIQEKLGADIIMPLDEPIPFPPEPATARAALDRTHAWWKRSRTSKTNLFAIVQGSILKEMRRESAETLMASDPPGYALGGFCMGEPVPQMDEVVEYTAQLLPDARPRYLMGVGMPRDILQAVKAGVDMFDCILPTRMGRTGMAFTADGPIRLRNAKFASDESPIDPTCEGPCCRLYTRAYLRHCFQVEEMLGPKLLSLHNVYYYGRLMRRIRESIRAGTLDTLRP